MKIGRIISLVLLMACLGIAGVQLLKSRNVKIDEEKPWTTVSKAAQGDLTFLGVYSRPPEFVSDRLKKWFSDSFWGRRWAFFRFDRGKYVVVRSARFEGRNVPAINFLEYKPALPSDSDSPFRYIGVAVPEQYSPEYQNGTLVLGDGAKEIGKWKMDGMPKATRQISESEPFVLAGEAAGCKLALESPVEQLNDRCNKAKELNGHIWAPMVRVMRPSSDPADKYQMLVQTERTTWHTWRRTGTFAVQLPVKGRVCAALNAVHPMPSDRIAFLAKVQKYRTLDETVVLKDVVLGSGQRYGRKYVLMSCSNPHIITKGGFEADVQLGGNDHISIADCFYVTVKTALPIDGGVIQSSPLYQQTKKPIAIECLNSRGGQTMGNLVDWAFPIPPNNNEEPIKIPELKIVIRQKAVLDEKTLHFMAPVKEVEKFTVFGKPKARKS